MERRFDIVTFDCYGTLIDWEAGIAGAFLEIAPGGGDADQILRAYAEVEPVVEAERYRSYREVLAEASRRAAERMGIRIPPGREGFLADSLPGWRPFPDANPALARLRQAGYLLGILSNVDRDLLAGTLEHLEVEFELLVTAQDVGSYKPAPDHFYEARRQVSGRPWVHAAQSFFHDIEPARALGIAAAWINRKGEAPRGGVRPEREFRTLSELADWLAP